MLTSNKYLHHHHKYVAWIAFSLSAFLLLMWAILIPLTWNHIISSHNRLGYLAGELGFTIPLGFVTWFGLIKGKLWASPLILVLVGAYTFDLIHLLIYLIQENFLGIPPQAYLVILVCLLNVPYWIGRKEIRFLSNSLYISLEPGQKIRSYKNPDHKLREIE